MTFVPSFWFKPVHYPLGCCTCRGDMSHSFSAISQYTQSGNGDCRGEYEALFRPHRGTDIYSIPKGKKAKGIVRNQNFLRLKSENKRLIRCPQGSSALLSFSFPFIKKQSVFLVVESMLITQLSSGVSIQRSKGLCKEAYMSCFLKIQQYVKYRSKNMLNLGFNECQKLKFPFYFYNSYFQRDSYFLSNNIIIVLLLLDHFSLDHLSVTQ